MKQLGLLIRLIIGIIAGIVVGSGIFYLGSYVLQRTNMNMGLALLCWIVGGVVSILGGLCFAELGACDPAAGSMVVYLDKAYHPVVGYMFGFTSWLNKGQGQGSLTRRNNDFIFMES